VKTAAVGVLAVVALATGCAADSEKPASDAGPASATTSTWETRDYAAEAPTSSELRAMSLEDLERLRAVIFGRHGRVFQDVKIQGWLASQPWYRPDTSFTNARLSKIERLSLDLVREAEAAKHPFIQPGDMRFYQQRIVTSAMLGTHTPQDWEVLKAEVLANHGYVFDDSDELENAEEQAALSTRALQEYFEERYWYVEDSRFQARQLTSTELANLDTITVAMTRQLGRTVSPGMMHLFAHTLLSDKSLEKVSIADLRTLRNEVFARHGREFRSEELRRWFKLFAWYVPRPNFSESELSEVERANIALITRREAQMHEELATRLLSVSDVMGLPPMHARRLRNEIYARHGRRFRDPALQRYFAGFAWYEPNDSFSEAQLNATERRNADLISQYESGRFTEG
jgi:hypothetical protein